MTASAVQTRISQLPAARRRGFVDWLLGRVDTGSPEYEREYWLRLARRMDECGTQCVGGLGDEVTEEWLPRLRTIHHIRRHAS